MIIDVITPYYDITTLLTLRHIDAIISLLLIYAITPAISLFSLTLLLIIDFAGHY
jgi:hypothetical protein